MSEKNNELFDTLYATLNGGTETKTGTRIFGFRLSRANVYAALTLVALILLGVWFKNFYEHKQTIGHLRDTVADSSELAGATESKYDVKKTLIEQRASSEQDESAIDGGMGDEAESETIYVFVSGAVLNAGVIECELGCRINDAIALAGGFSQEANRDYVNLAQTINDGDQVHVPTLGEVGVVERKPLASENKKLPQALININDATAADLDNLPGIGPALAERIVDYRETNGDFREVNELQSVKGIGPAVFAKLENQVSVE